MSTPVPTDAPAEPPESEAPVERDHDFVQSLERGLSVLRCFSADHPALTLSEVARLTGLTRATARRLLLTFERLGYMRNDGRLFELTPAVLDLGYAYISSCKLPDLVQPDMEALSERCNESVSATVLDGDEIVYIARVPTKRIMTIALSLGSRLPAAITSMGRVLLADLPEDELRARLNAMDVPKRTVHTEVDPIKLASLIGQVRSQGWALVDQELEEGVRSVAAPLRDRTGRTIAAINVSTHAGRMSLEQLRGPILDSLLETVASINARLGKR
ncbi:MAG TPA: IclR family transcriptional regulator C-terminal domain-containing protein [Acidimicrobiales bacterium]|nr:IclR family transcriptional regulator C-terminal domain-containing protein [Acidimicrobiales bacterium]